MWIKYRFRFAAHHGSWEWLHVDSVKTQADAEEHVDEEVRRLRYDDSERFRGADVELVPAAPQWVVERALRAAGMQLTAAEREVQKYVTMLTETSPCLQCDSAVAVTYSNASRLHCPSCGRLVDPTTITFLLMPTETAAVALLKIIVEKGPLYGPRDWPFDENAPDKFAFQRLVDLGLASGSSKNDKYTVEASARGIREWQVHKEHAK